MTALNGPHSPIDVDREPEVTTPELRMLRVEIHRLTAAVTQLSGVLSAIAHDVRSTREKINVIEARLPRRRIKKVARE
jgi:hypothetical protein